MATHLDLEEQEQLDQLKHFWNRYGNLVTAVAVLIALGVLGMNGWNWWQRDQAVKAGAMYDEIEKTVQAGDAERATSLFAGLKDRFPRTAFAQQAALLVAKLQFEKGQAGSALGTLAWVAERGGEREYQAIARLRLAGLLADQKKYDEALKQLDEVTDKEFAALAADRRGDILLALGKKDQARAAYQKAWADMDAKVDYRHLIEAKLTAMGSPPEAEKSTAAETAK